MKRVKTVLVLILICIPVSVLVTLALMYLDTVEPENNIITEYTIKPSGNPGYYCGGFSLSFDITDTEGKHAESNKLNILYTLTVHRLRTPVKNELTSKTGEKYMFSGGKLPAYESTNVEGIRKTYKYDSPILMENTSRRTVRVYEIRACIYEEDKQLGNTQTFTYIIGDVNSGYSDYFNVMVVCITTDEDNLYDYEKGIMISGETFDLTGKNNPQREIDWWYPRNYNQRGIDWEREAHIDFFERDGKLVLSQNAGIRVSGGTSRNSQIKSFKLVAREYYDKEKDSFNYAFFDELYDINGKSIKQFDKLILRNSVNDDGGTMIRDQLLHDIGAKAGLDYQAGRPAIVFLNGKYYSFMTLKQSLDSDNIEARYKIPEENISIIAVQSDFYQFRYKLESGTTQYFNEFINDMRYLINTNFKNKDISEIENIIDVDNFIKYMSYQLFIVNPDWPHNNVLAWKYNGETNNSVHGMDGKWRFILKDLDFGLRNYTADTFNTCLNGSMYNNDPHLGRVLGNLLKNKDFRQRFNSFSTSLCTEILTKEILQSAIIEASDERIKDMELYWFYFGGNRKKWNATINEWLEFSEKRSSYFLPLIKRYCS